MAEYLFPGTIIQKIDDEQLVLPQGKDTDIWTEYMGDSTRMSDVGWCVPAESFLAATTACCHSGGIPYNSDALSCFTSLVSGEERRCIDPMGFMTNVTAERCSASPSISADSGDYKEDSDSDSASNTNGAYQQSCKDLNALCVRPAPHVELLRLTFIHPSASLLEEDGKRSMVILWSGPRREILEQVLVDTRRLTAFFSFAFVDFLTYFYSYLTTANLSLFFFNLLPLSFLDGGQLLGTLLRWNASGGGEHFGMRVTRRRSSGDADLEGGNIRRPQPLWSCLARVPRLRERDASSLSLHLKAEP